MPPLNQKKNEKKRGCSGASVAIGWALAQGGTLAASPEEDRDVGGLSYTCRSRCPPPPRGGSSQDGPEPVGRPDSVQRDS